MKDNIMMKPAPTCRRFVTLGKRVMSLTGFGPQWREKTYRQGYFGQYPV